MNTAGPQAGEGDFDGNRRVWRRSNTGSLEECSAFRSGGAHRVEMDSRCFGRTGSEGDMVGLGSIGIG